MLSLWLVWTFRLIHILSGIFWTGGALVVAAFLVPSARALGPGGAPFMDQLVRVRKLPRALLGAGTAAVLSGGVLFWHDSLGGTSTAWMDSPAGRFFGLGGLIATIALVVGFTVNMPTAKKVGLLSAAVQAHGGPPTAEEGAEMQRLQKRLGKAAIAVAALLLLAASAMALARYAP